MPGLENTKRAMDIAEREFKIPQVAKNIKNIVIIVIIIISIIAFIIQSQTFILNVPRFLSLNILPPHIWTSSAG